MRSRVARGLTLSVAVAGLSACTTTSTVEEQLVQTQQENQTLKSSLASLQGDLDQRDQSIKRIESDLALQSDAAPVSDLLPPKAKPGECYARVWVPPTYRTVTEEVLVQEPGERVEVVPARYEMVREQVLVEEGSTRLEAIPAVYGEESETIQTREEALVWRLNKDNSASPASKDLLAAARAGGADLDSASVGMCFHEHYKPAQFATESKDVLVREASSEVSVVEPSYRWVEKQVLVSEASNRMEDVPAVYQWSEERIIDKPAHTVWKKGTGPIQRIDEATGEIMCLVEVPATYKTVKKRVLVSPATTRTVELPAQYETVRVRELVADGGETTQAIPAEYRTVAVTRQVEEARHVWHEVHNTREPATTRTGARICLTRTPPEFQTITRTVVKAPATTRSVEVPAQYKTVEVRKLVAPTEEKRFAVPAEFRSVTRQELDTDGHMQWRSILCETNMTAGRVRQIQAALRKAGYEPGRVDGVVGTQTMQAVNAFQRAEGLPVDRYLNIPTVEALGVSVR